MESPAYLSPNPTSGTLSSSDYGSDYTADMFKMASNLNKNAAKSTESTSRKSTKKSISSFVQKLYNMLEDDTHGNLIYWNPSGTSFSVCNAKAFSAQVLPAHFKHSNFSSFVRLLNMYGFHKISKSPRGQRSSDMEVWEFSHPKLIRGRPDLLKNIKRKAMDAEMIRRETSDIQSSFSLLQSSQNELLKQFCALRENIAHFHLALDETKKTQQYQGMQIQQLMEQHGISKNDINMNMDNSQPSPPLTHRESLSAPNEQYSSYQAQQQPQQQTNEPFQMMVTTPTASNNNVLSSPTHGFTSQGTESSTPSSYWINNSNAMTDLSISQPSLGSFSNSGNNDKRQHQQQSNALYSPMTLQAAVNTPLPPSPRILGSPELDVAPSTSDDSHSSFTFDFGHSNTLDPTFI